jgi:hypothetical protein
VSSIVCYSRIDAYSLLQLITHNFFILACVNPYLKYCGGRNIQISWSLVSITQAGVTECDKGVGYGTHGAVLHRLTSQSVIRELATGLTEPYYTGCDTEVYLMIADWIIFYSCWASWPKRAVRPFYCCCSINKPKQTTTCGWLNLLAAVGGVSMHTNPTRQSCHQATTCWVYSFNYSFACILWLSNDEYLL